MSAGVASGKQHPAGAQGRLEADVDGGLVRLRARYDPELVERLRALPGRRFIRERAEWIIPARREALVEVAALVDSLGDEVHVTERARRRLERARPGRVENRDGEFELSFAYNPRLLGRVRSIPERRYYPERRTWTVPPTRAGALALLALLEDDELTAPPAVAERLTRLAAARDPHENGRIEAPQRASEEPRSSPAPRHQGGEGDRRQADGCAERADDHAAPLETAPPVDVRPGLVDVRQPGAAEGSRDQPRGRDGSGVDRVARRKRQRRTDQLVGFMAHAAEASRKVGRLPS